MCFRFWNGLHGCSTDPPVKSENFAKSELWMQTKVFFFGSNKTSTAREDDSTSRQLHTRNNPKYDLRFAFFSSMHVAVENQDMRRNRSFLAFCTHGMPTTSANHSLVTMISIMIIIILQQRTNERRRRRREVRVDNWTHLFLDLLDACGAVRAEAFLHKCDRIGRAIFLTLLLGSRFP